MPAISVQDGAREVWAHPLILQYPRTLRVRRADEEWSFSTRTPMRGWTPSSSEPQAGPPSHLGPVCLNPFQFPTTTPPHLRRTPNLGPSQILSHPAHHTALLPWAQLQTSTTKCSGLISQACLDELLAAGLSPSRRKEESGPSICPWAPRLKQELETMGRGPAWALVCHWPTHISTGCGQAPWNSGKGVRVHVAASVPLGIPGHQLEGTSVLPSNLPCPRPLFVPLPYQLPPSPQICISQPTLPHTPPPCLGGHLAAGKAEAADGMPQLSSLNPRSGKKIKSQSVYLTNLWSSLDFKVYIWCVYVLCMILCTLCIKTLQSACHTL